MRLATSRTCSIVAADTSGSPLSARDTVLRVTPASAATISRVGRRAGGFVVRATGSAYRRVVCRGRKRAGDDRLVGERRILERALLRLVVHPHQPEPLVVPPRPF